MGIKLIIVESPNKVKKIQSFLNKDEWLVAASAGHIRDLPDKKMGVSPPNFVPEYVIDKSKSKLIASLKSKIKISDSVYLATDPDREGEAIAWHLKDYFNITKPIRITFTEITKKAIIEAIKNSSTIDMNLVRAQEARRVLDRIVGYTISPILSIQSGIKLSAGRVQSPAVKLVSLREKEISQFRKRNHYSLNVDLDGITAELFTSDFLENDNKFIFDKKTIEFIKDKVNEVEITSIETKEQLVNPKPPFNTSTLQQFGYSELGFSPDKTMKIAQTLFEKGMISYHRTDSLNFSEDTFNEICHYWKIKGVDHQEEQIKWKSKEGAQEAHEAIKPTYLNNEHEEGSDDEKSIYDLIRNRAILSVLPSGVDLKTQLIATSKSNTASVSQAKFVANTKIIKSLGWREQVAPKKESIRVTNFDSLKVGAVFSVNPVILTRQTEPPKRFNEASLIKAMEKLGIGRPSTYAAILENIKKREYVKIEKKDLVPTKIGTYLVDSLKSMTFMNLEYTKIVESQLDKISKNETSYLDLLTLVYKNLEKEKESIRIPVLIHTEDCPKCMLPLKKITPKKPKKPFWVHANEGDANDCDQYFTDKNGSPVVEKTIIKKCPKCSNDIKRISKNNNVFWIHLEYENSNNCDRYISDKEVN